MAGDQPNRTVKSVARTCEIIDALRRSGGATVSELGDAVDLAPGTIHTHLSTLKQEGFVVQQGDRYKLGYRLLTLGEHVRNNTELFREGRTQTDQLADDTGETVHLTVESDGLEIVLYESFGKRAVGTRYFIRNREEPRQHLHCSASGKAILAHLPEERVEDVVERRGLEQVTRNTITDRAELFAELETVRERGYAVDDEEQILGIRGVGAPILGDDSRVHGAISISGPVSRLDADRLAETYPREVMSAANIIEVNLHTNRGSNVGPA